MTRLLLMRQLAAIVCTTAALITASGPATAQALNLVSAKSIRALGVADSDGHVKLCHPKTTRLDRGRCVDTERWIAKGLGPPGLSPEDFLKLMGEEGRYVALSRGFEPAQQMCATPVAGTCAVSSDVKPVDHVYFVWVHSQLKRSSK